MGGKWRERLGFSQNWGKKKARDLRGKKEWSALFPTKENGSITSKF